MRARARARVRACVGACVRACVRACVHTARARSLMCVCACLYVPMYLSAELYTNEDFLVRLKCADSVTKADRFEAETPPELWFYFLAFPSNF